MANFQVFSMGNEVTFAIDKCTNEIYTTALGYSILSGINLNTTRCRLGVGFKGISRANLKPLDVPSANGAKETVWLLPFDCVFKWFKDDRERLGSALTEEGVSADIYTMLGYSFEF